MITKSELIEYLKHTPENTNYNILYSSLYNGQNKEIVDEFIEVLSRGNLSLAALQPYLAKLYEDDKTISPDPLPPFSSDDVQPDWNQNDETQPDYVKNRPFYIGNPVETVLVEDSTVTFEDDGGIYIGQLESTFSATVGETYKVSWDGTTYECACVDYSGTAVIGNLSIIGVGSDTGEPFLMFVNNGLLAIGTADTASSHTFSISALVPKVVKIDKKYLSILFKPKGKSYLTFSSPNEFTLEVYDKTKHWDGTLEYFASDETWTVWDGTSSLLAEANGSEYVLYLRGTGNTVISNYTGWNLEGSDISCIGNIETLLDYATVESGEHPVMAASCYSNLFQDCTNLTRAPELPATTLANYCYSFMFRGCISLTSAPELPATALANSCYQGMFHNCTSLTHAPALPATTLAEACYEDMFNGCTSLTQAPALPATTLAGHCYYGMFSCCTSLTRAPELSATTLADYCYNWMFVGCTSLTHASALPATTLADHCYWYMFSGCTSLTQAPTLPATALADYCYQGMFYNCTSLKLSSTKTDEYTQEYRIPSSGNGTTATDALTNMFTSTGGTFTGTPEINTIYYLSSDNMIVRGNDIANLNGYVKTMIDAAVDIPTTLPNPNALTFTGAVNATYDGSTAVSVEIPSGGADISLGLASAAVGQIPKVKAVDSNGVPTEWEATAMPSGGGGSGGSPDAVLYTSQTLTDAQKKQARQNIDVESYFVVNGTMTNNFKPKLDKTFSQIREAISDGKIPIVAMSGAYFQLSQNTDELITFLLSVADGNSSGFQTIDVYPTAVPQIHFYSMLRTDIYGALPQINMASDPTEAMQIATKKYVDEHAGGVTTLHINVTAVNQETREATFTADKTPLEMQQASINGPVWCVVTFAAGIMGEEALSTGVPPAWYGGAPAFGGLVAHIHSDAGNNDINYAIRAAAGSDSWVFDINQFGE